MKRKVLAMILAIAMIISLVPSALALTATQTVSAAAAKAGDIVSVAISIDEDVKDCIGWDYKLYFDPNVFALDHSELGVAPAATMVSLITRDPSNVYYTINWIDTTSEGQTLPKGTLATLYFKVLADVAEEKLTTFKLVCDSMLDTTFFETFEDVENSVANSEVTVTVSPAPTVTGYTVTASEDKTIVAGENAIVTVTVGGDEKTYNAYDLTLTYDAEKLTYVSGVAADEGATVSEEDGTIRVVGYGADKAIDSAAVTLTFRGKAIGDANVVISSAKVDISNKAISSDAPEATVLDDTTVITISGYTVKLGDGLTGESTVAPGEDYTFTATDWDNYDYVISGTMGGEDVTIIDNGDGTYTVENVTGDLDISAVMTPKSYTVTINGEDVTGENTATYNTPYTFILKEQSGFTYEVAVTVDGKAYTGYTVADGVYTIPGTDITGDIVITVTKTAIPVTEYKVTVEGSGAGDVTAASTATAGEDYTFTLNKATGFAYTITATMDGETVEIIDNDDGTYTIKAVSGDIVITVDKTSNLTVDVVEYITLDEQSMYLVTVSGTIAEGSVAKYDGMAMFWSEKYNAYAWLVISAEGLDAVKAEAAAKVTMAAGTAAGNVDYSGDVNGTELVDVNDAQLTYDMYNAKYASFDQVSMQKFLNGDVNGDKTVNVNDAAAIVSTILGNVEQEN